MSRSDYAPRSDRLSDRRISRTRFAARCLPSLAGTLLVVWLAQQMLGQISDLDTANLPLFDVIRFGGSFLIFATAAYMLVRHQHRHLEKRCNDAGSGWGGEEWLFRVGRLAAPIGMLLPFWWSPVVAVVLAQFIYGLSLPYNPLPNLSGYPRRDDAPLLPLAWMSGLTAIAMVALVFLA